MKPADELRLLARRYRWAFRELVISQFQLEWNQLCNRYGQRYEEEMYGHKMRRAREMIKSVKLMYAYLVAEYGSGAAVLTELKQIAYVQRRPLRALALEEIPL